MSLKIFLSLLFIFLYATTYYRTTIEIPNSTVFLNFLLRVKYDDRAAVYINGVEQFCQNLTNNAAFDDCANGTVSDEEWWKNATTSVFALISGTNSVSIRIASLISTDQGKNYSSLRGR